MAFVVSAGSLDLVSPLPVSTMPVQVRLADGVYRDYATMYRTQPQLRTVISFLARNIAQLGIHVFRRVSDTDRVRLGPADSQMAALMGRPSPTITPYRLVERLVADIGLYDIAYWVKVTTDAGQLALAPLPAARVRPKGNNILEPEYYELSGVRGTKRFEPDELVVFHGYNPDDLRIGSSPVEALRTMLAEEFEATRSREQMWRNGGRLSGILKRPAGAPTWAPDARARFKESWRSFRQGGGSEGGTPLLEDGMEYEAIDLDPRTASYVESRKLTREEVAAAYHIPLPMVGILDHATFSNIKEQHQQLYQDTLGPWLEMITQEIMLQLLPDLDGPASGVYVEFNLEAKMRGSFEEQAAAASTATGGPWMTRNEQRARFNLPSLPGGDELITPLNVTAGGLASPRDSAPKTRTPAARKSGPPKGIAGFDAERDTLASKLQALSERQMDAVLRQAGVKDVVLPDLLAAWEASAGPNAAQVQALFSDRVFRLAQVGAWEVLAEHNDGAEGWSADVMLPWLLAAADSHAAQHIAAGTALLQAAVAETDWRQAITAAAASWATAVAGRRAVTAATEARSFGGHDAAQASGLEYKVWHTGGSSPRVSHRALDGDRVLLDDVFGNGCRWPGDAHGREEETANCNCRLTYDRKG
ncbi:phage portal protein [Kitasatospora sp. NPDC005856]|uniref:phage portal protein n=1 Tax=Kitasatospora sp. NPDC005856 TaxID=3154566 RepID=UPI0033D25937